MHDSTPTRLSQLATKWSLLQQAHGDPDAGMVDARRQLLERYSRPVYQYLLGAVRDSEVAGDLAQDFAVRFLRGGFQGADPAKGRFRDYVRKALIHLVIHYRRTARRPSLEVPGELAAPPEPETGLEAAEANLLRAWREELLNRAWVALRRLEERTGRPVYLVLRLGFEHRHMRSAELAEVLARRLGKPVTAGGARQALHRARQEFAALLLEEVAQTVGGPDPDRLTEELIDLDLLKYCGPVLRQATSAAH